MLDIVKDLLDRNKNIPDRQKRLRERVESVENRSSNPYRSAEDRFLKTAEELNTNFEQYGNDLYHGTWGAGAEQILETGLKGSKKGSRLTGETGTDTDVSLTHLPSVAFHYSMDQTPNTVSVVADFMERNFEYSRTKKGELTQDVAEYVEYLPEPERIEDEYVQHNIRKLKKLRKSSSNFQEYPEEVERRIPVHELVFGVDYKALENISEPETVTRNEFQALDSGSDYHPLGEVKAAEVSEEDLTVYVPQEFTDSYRDKDLNMNDVKSFDALMLHHELEMENVYRERGVLELGEFWKGSRLGLEKRQRSWDNRPEIIDVSY